MMSQGMVWPWRRDALYLVASGPPSPCLRVWQSPPFVTEQLSAWWVGYSFQAAPQVSQLATARHPKTILEADRLCSKLLQSLSPKPWSLTVCFAGRSGRVTFPLAELVHSSPQVITLMECRVACSSSHRSRQHNCTALESRFGPGGLRCNAHGALRCSVQIQAFPFPAASCSIPGFGCFARMFKVSASQHPRVRPEGVVTAVRSEAVRSSDGGGLSSRLRLPSCCRCRLKDVCCWHS